LRSTESEVIYVRARPKRRSEDFGVKSRLYKTVGIGDHQRRKCTSKRPNSGGRYQTAGTKVTGGSSRHERNTRHPPWLPFGKAYEGITETGTRLPSNGRKVEIGELYRGDIEKNHGMKVKDDGKPQH